MAGTGAVKTGVVAESLAAASAVLESRSSEDSVSARSKASIQRADTGDSRRQVRHSGPVAGGPSPPIVHVPSSQHIIRTTQ